MGTVRPAAVAGRFYPADPAVLRRTVEHLLGQAAPPDTDVATRMLIVPHAGYEYSGPVAAVAYRILPKVRRVVLVGPSHFVVFRGIATPGADFLATPLGDVPADHDVAVPTGADPVVAPNPAAHAREHSLEVQLPFLQVVLDEFSALAMLTGTVSPEEMADVLDSVIADEETAGVISSDLSHYLGYEAAHRRDAATIANIEQLRAEDIGWDDACGRTGVQAALLVARRRGWKCRLLDHRNSGDTAGTKERVVGYAAFTIGPVV
jgi:hypothetical protein